MIKGSNIKLDIQKVIEYRNFGNKLWNATNFFLKFAMDKDKVFSPNIKDTLSQHSKLSFIDKWILNKFSRLVFNFNKAFESYTFGDAVSSVYSFWIDNFCDVYIEACKAVFKGDDELAKEQTRNIMFYVMIESLKILHPIAPFITEELYQRINYEVLSKLDKNINIESICISTFPEDSTYIDDEIEENGNFVCDIVHKILGTVPQFILDPEISQKIKAAKEQGQELKKPKLSILISSDDKKLEEFVINQKVIISTLAKVESFGVLFNKETL